MFPLNLFDSSVYNCDTSGLQYIGLIETRSLRQKIYYISVCICSIFALAAFFHLVTFEYILSLALCSSVLSPLVPEVFKNLPNLSRSWVSVSWAEVEESPWAV